MRQPASSTKKLWPRLGRKSRHHYRDEGALATIGRHAAIADLGRIKLTGFIAWVLWGVVHIFFLIGFRNRLAVFVNWIWAWLTYGRGARLITGEVTALAPISSLLGAPKAAEGVRDAADVSDKIAR